MKTIFDKELEEVIKDYPIAIVGNQVTITADQFKMIQEKALEIQEATGLKIVITNFMIN